jgi:RNA polymerase sigma-32 factor
MKKILDQINTEDKDYQLISKWKENQDTSIFNQIIKNHHWLVCKIAKNYRYSGLDQKDLVAEGILGLAIAMEKFDMEKNVKFSTYASYWIKAKMSSFVWKFKNTVYVSSNKLTRFMNEMYSDKPTELRNNIDKIAYEVFKKPMYHMHDKISGDLEWKDVLYDRSNLEEEYEEQEEMNLAQDLLKKSIVLLDKRSREILEDRWFNERPKTYREIAERYNLSVERIRQIELLALENLKKNVKHQMDQLESSVMGQLTVISIIRLIMVNILLFVLSRFFAVIN